MTIRIENDMSIKVTAPINMPNNAIQNILNDKRNWIEKKLLEKKQIQTEYSAIIDKKCILLMGKQCLVIFGDVPNTCFVDGKIIFPSKLQTNSTDFDKNISKFLLNVAKSNLPKLVSIWGTKMSLCPSAIKIKKLKSKWGSCNGDGEIVLNSRLVQIPPKIAEYVVVHELCHLKNLNHSDAFWSDVERYLPDYAQRKEDLKKYNLLTTI